MNSRFTWNGLEKLLWTKIALISGMNCNVGSDSLGSGSVFFTPECLPDEALAIAGGTLRQGSLGGDTTKIWVVASL